METEKEQDGLKHLKRKTCIVCMGKMPEKRNSNITCSPGCSKVYRRICEFLREQMIRKIKKELEK